MTPPLQGTPLPARATRLAVLTSGVALVLGVGVVAGEHGSSAIALPNPGACKVSPMAAAMPVGSDAPFTIWTSGNTHLRNQELEGAIAVGGTLRVSSASGSGQYPVVHKIAGDGDYDVPVIDNDRTRMFLGAYAFSSGDIRVQLKTEGATLPSQKGGIKLASTDPAYTFGAGENNGNAYYRGTNSNEGIVDLGSTFGGAARARTAMTSDHAWADYFPVSTTSTTAALDEAAYSTPVVLGTSGEAGVRLAAGANQVALASIAGISKMRLEGDATGVLYVKVAQADVVGGVLTLPSLVSKPASSRILWNLSDVTGAVRITTQGEPIRGAIYAPQVDLAVNDKEIEGQIVARSFDDSAGNEIHTYIFASTLPCAAGSPTTTPTTTPPTSTPTAGPTTAGPTTAAPSGAPTSGVPTTGAPTTGAPTTAAPEATPTGSTPRDPSDGVDATSDPGPGETDDPRDDDPTDDDPTDDDPAGAEDDASTPGPADGLPATGAQAGIGSLLALLLAGGGIGLLALRRRQDA